MKIVTRFLAGYAVLLAMLAAALIYQAIAVHRIQATNEQLTRINFRTALDSIDLLRRLDLVEEYSKKCFASRDPGYRPRLRAFEQQHPEMLPVTMDRPAPFHIVITNHVRLIAGPGATDSSFHDDLLQSITSPV